jgi:hypothetical protein
MRKLLWKGSRIANERCRPHPEPSNGRTWPRITSGADGWWVTMPPVLGATGGKTFYEFSSDFYANYLQLTVLSWKTQEPCLT